MKTCLILFACLVFFACRKEYSAPVPDWTNWDAFEAPNALPLPSQTHNAIEGVYDVSAGAETFGDKVAVKTSYVINNHDTTWHYSIFCGKDIGYFICEGRRVNSDILLNGYWRKMVSTETGIVRFTITAANGGSILLSQNPNVTAGSVKVTGVFGNGENQPTDSISLVYNRKLNPSNSFQVIAHRAGGRTSDLLPASENSVAMIHKAAEYGATGVEIDIRLTKDDSMILYHDATINLRETEKSGLVGPIENYTYRELSNFIRLVRGEKIPTVRQALDAVIYETPIRFVYLDTKITTKLDQLQQIQSEYRTKAAAAGRNVEILIGIPAQDQLDNFLLLPGYTSTPSLCELSIDDVRKANSRVWAPRWTLGTQNEKVAEMHSEGRRVYVWTMDVPTYIDQYLDEGQLDGILTNYPSYVAYAHYIRQ